MTMKQQAVAEHVPQPRLGALRDPDVVRLVLALLVLAVVLLAAPGGPAPAAA